MISIFCVVGGSFSIFGAVNTSTPSDRCAAILDVSKSLPMNALNVVSVFSLWLQEMCKMLPLFFISIFMWSGFTPGTFIAMWNCLYPSTYLHLIVIWGMFVEFLFQSYLYGICSAMHVSFVGSLDFWSTIGFRCCFLEILRNCTLISGQFHKVSSSRLSFLADPVLVWLDRHVSFFGSLDFWSAVGFLVHLVFSCTSEES